MSNCSSVASATTLTILDNEIRCVDGLYSLNDLHRASGGAAKHQPNRFLRLEQTQALIAAIDAENFNENKHYPDMGSASSAENFNENNHYTNLYSAIQVINGGENRGTYVCKEIVIAYAAWISPEFHLAVLRVFLHHVENENKDYDLLAERVAELEDLVHNQMINKGACIIKAPPKNRHRLTSRFPMKETSATTNMSSGSPRPSAMRFFYASMKGIRQFNGGLRAPNKTPSGNKRHRLDTVVEARHLTKVAINETKCLGDFYV